MLEKILHLKEFIASDNQERIENIRKILFEKREKLAATGFLFALVGLFIHTIALVLRTFESGHAPFTNMYESLSFLAWSSILAYVIIEFKYKIRKAGAYFLLIVIAFQGHFFAHVPQSSHKPSSIITAMITTSSVVLDEVLKFLQFSCEFRFIFPDLIDVLLVGCYLMYAYSEVVDCARNLILP